MPPMIDYFQDQRNRDPSPYTRPAIVLAMLTLACFTVPFALLYAFRLYQRAQPPDSSMVVAGIILAAMVLWFVSGILGLFAIVVGSIAICHGKPTLWTIVATTLSATIVLFELIAVAAGFLRTLHSG